jgi:hypothetical protein
MPIMTYSKFFFYINYGMTKFLGAFLKRLEGRTFFSEACSGLPRKVYLWAKKLSNKSFLSICGFTHTKRVDTYWAIY